MRILTWRNRRTTLVALLITILVFLILEYLADADASVLEKYNLSTSTIQVYYSLLISALALLTIFEPRIRPLLRNQKVSILVIPLAGMVSFLVIWLINQPQETRLFQFPFSLWLIITHVVILCGLAVVLVTSNPHEMANSRLLRIAISVSLILLLALAILHVASMSAFMRIDTPDEPANVSMATNFAENGDLSPTFLASSYGRPDIVFPRGYYLAMGLWLRLIQDTSLAALRTFPLLVGVLSAAVLAVAIRRTQTFTTLQIVVSVATLFSLSAFVRTTHNLRMDVALSLYGVLALWGILEFFRGEVSPPSADYDDWCSTVDWYGKCSDCCYTLRHEYWDHFTDLDSSTETRVSMGLCDPLCDCLRGFYRSLFSIPVRA